MTPIMLLLFVPPAILFGLIPYVWRHRTTSGAKSFLMLMIAVAVWGVCYAIQIASAPDLSVKVFWSAAKYVGITLTPVVWLAFAMEYVGRSGGLTRRKFAVLFIIPSITIILSFANPQNLMWTTPRLVTTAQFVTIDSSFGPWFWVHAAYSYVLIMLGIVVLVRSVVRFPQMYRQQVGALALAAALPLVANAVVIFGLSPDPYLDLTPVAFTASALLYSWALFRYRLLDIAPAARDAVIESMTDVVIVVDQNNRVIDLNPAGQQVIGKPAIDVIGQPVDYVLSDWSHIVERFLGMNEVHEELTLPSSEGQRHFDLRIAPLSDRQGRQTGRVVVLRDITEGRLAESLRESEQRTSRRATQLQTVAEVARAVTSVRTLAELLPLVARLIGERFDFYHVAVFLLDEAREWAVLQAANSSEGQRLLADGHKLKVDPTSLVGHVAGSGAGRIAANDGRDAAFVNSPDLPLTHSEMALPLKTRDQVIGVLDVHSTRDNAFTAEDAVVLATLADQVASAIENAQSFERLEALAEENRQLLARSEQAVKELNVLTRRLTGEGWEKYLTQAGGELTVENTQPESMLSFGDLSELDHAADKADLVVSAENNRRALAVPIVLRGEVLGALGLEDPESGEPWSEDEVDLVKEVTERVTLALDNARLFQESQAALANARRLAEHGQVINRILATVSSSFDMNHILDVIAAELAQALSLGHVGITVLNEARTAVTLVADRPFAPDGSNGVGIVLPLAGNPATQQVIASQQSMVIPDAQTSPLTASIHEIMRQRGTHALMILPLGIRNQVIGTVGLDILEQGRTFTPEEIQLAETLVAQASIAIQNARLFEQTQTALAETTRRSEQLVVLNELGRALGATLNIDAILNAVYTYLSRVMNTENFFIALYDSATNMISFPLSLSYNDSRPVRVESRLLKLGLTDHVIRQRQPLLISDNIPARMAELGLEFLAFGNAKPALSWLGVPMILSDQVLGAIVVQSVTTPGVYREIERDLLLAAAGQAAIAIQNARLFEQIERRVQRERLIADISRKMLAANDLRSIAQIAGAELGRALQVTRTAVRIGADTTNPSVNPNGSVEGDGGMTL